MTATDGPVKQIGPFYFPRMFSSLGFGGAGGVMAAVVGVAASTLVALVQFNIVAGPAEAVTAV